MTRGAAEAAAPAPAAPAAPASVAAARGTLWALLWRVLSFGCTQITFRWVDPSVLGKAHIELELLLTTILFLSREGFRLTLTKHYNAQIAQWTVPVHSLVALGAYLVFQQPLFPNNNNNNNNNNDIVDYQYATILYCVAAWIEGWAEPSVLWCLATMRVTVKTLAEGTATVAKTVSTIVLLRFLSGTAPVTAFGLAQIVYALVYNAVVYLQTNQQQQQQRQQQQQQQQDKKENSNNNNNNGNTTTTATTTTSSSTTTTTTAMLIVTFTIQGIFKHALTEGDRIVLLAISQHYDQGLYAIGSSYGGMAARLLLQPLEENARLLWSHQQSLSSSTQTTTTTTTTELQRSYTLLVKLVVHVGLLFACVAVHYTDVLLVLLGQTREAGPVVSAFCVYTALLAWNGMTEAFVYGVVSSQTEVGRVGLAHTAVGLGFALLAPPAVQRYGTVGLVATNGLAMALRGLYAVSFATRHFSSSSTTRPSLAMAMGQLIRDMMPHPVVLVCGFLASLVVTGQSLVVYQNQLPDPVGLRNPQWRFVALRHVGVGVACVLGIATLVVVQERAFLQSLRFMFVRRRIKQD